MVSVKRQPRKWLFILGSAILGLALLSACGDSTATNIPAAATSATTAAATSGASNAAPGNNGANPPAGITPGANGQPGGAPGQGQFGGPGQFGGQVISGTVQSYDSSTKALVVKSADGKTEQLTATNPVLVKNSKLTTDQLGQLLTGTTLVSVQGNKASDGTYTARDVLVMNGNIAGQFGGPGGFRGGQGVGANGTPGAGANGSPRAGRGAGNNGGTPPANFTPGAGFFRGGQGANGIPGLILRDAKFADGKLTGTNPITGETATVVLTSTTVLTERTAGDINDLKAGVAVTVRMRAAQNNNQAEALTITYTTA